LRPDPARWFDYKIDVQCAKYLKITLVEVAFPQVCFLDRLFQPAETKNPQPVVHETAIYRVVIMRMRSHEPTLDYVRRRMAEGKTKKEVIRCLKRFVAREIFGHLCRAGAATVRLSAP
jgi:hypothetical protein